MRIGEWISLLSLVAFVIGNGGFGGWFMYYSARRRKHIDDALERMDDCLHRVERNIVDSNSAFTASLVESERRTSSALSAFQAQVASRSEVESRISKDVAAAVLPLREDIARIDRRLDSRNDIGPR